MGDDLELSRAEIEFLIDQFVFSERDRAILKRRWLDGICYEPLSEEFGLSVRQTINVCKKARAQVFKHVK